jgi:hypothetical protein
MNEKMVEAEFELRAGAAGEEIIRFLMERGEEWIGDMHPALIIPLYNAALWKALKCVNMPHDVSEAKKKNMKKYVREYEEFADELTDIFVKLTKFLGGGHDEEERPRPKVAGRAA